jgi:BNR repeat-containing family member
MKSLPGIRVTLLALAVLLGGLSRAIGASGEVNSTGPTPQAAPKTIVQFNDNGAWCWYQDPRAVVDQTTNTLLVGSVANSAGLDGRERSGDIDLVSYHLATGRSERFVLHYHLQPEDDHNAPALLIRTDGRYVAMYSKHNQEATSYWRVTTRPHDATHWDPEQTFDWKPYLKASNHVTYSNLFYLSAERRTYDFTRAVNLDPSILTSTDQGDHWTYAGKLLTLPRLGYVNGYARYASNGVDRIDVITTEHHPRDFNNSIYHGYLKNGKLHRSDGTIVDNDVFHSDGHPQTELTKVFAANSVFGSDTMTHAWTVDLRLDAANRPYAILSCRTNDSPENSNFQDHRFFYARFDGAAWNIHPLAKAGARLWESEQDYTGLAALDPYDPNVAYVSTSIDPRDGSRLPVHEIFKGVSTNAGGTWEWTAITQNSPADNLRPIVPASDPHHTALLWFRGKMIRSQRYDCQVVGLIDRP